MRISIKFALNESSMLSQFRAGFFSDGCVTFRSLLLNNHNNDDLQERALSEAHPGIQRFPGMNFSGEARTLYAPLSLSPHGFEWVYNLCNLCL